MHFEAYSFVKHVLRVNDVNGTRVLEIGSLNVNGSVRSLFKGCAEYTGIDRKAGSSVDIQIDAREYTGMDHDIVVCCEVLEHDPEPEKVIECAWRSLVPGGLLILTAAGPGREAHNCDGSKWDGREHYENIKAEKLSELLARWSNVTIQCQGCDIYATAVKL
jgi:SAM-dependent methyltransferase